MGSLRNPIGPLPSSIYWRRRAIALSLIALLAVLTVWALSSGGGGGDKDDNANGSSSSAPSTITPGPTRSGPAISAQPGGRDDGGAGDGPGGSASGGTGPGTGHDTGGGDGDTGSGGQSSGGGAGTGGAGTGGAGGGGSGSGGSAGQRVAADSALPNCAPGTLKLTLRTPEVSYEPGKKPSFRLSAANTSDTTCKADFGPRAAVLTVTDDSDDQVWSSEHCPRTQGSLFLRIPAGGTVTHTVEWDREQSAPRCATTPAGQVSPGTYLVEADFPGATVLPASFRLDKD
ncbi:hypothetical protein ACWF94_05180 [Streptomyces sp. NPDC055078]